MIEILRRHSFSITFLVILVVFVFLSRDGEDDIHQLSGYTMGTTYQIQIVDMPNRVSSEDLAAEVSALLTELDTGIFSTYAAESELSRFNRHAVNVPFIASTQLLNVLQLAQSISEITDGTFDVTVGPLVNLWGFGPTIGVLDSIPPQERVNSVMESIGYRNLEIDAARSEIRKSKALYVDLSGIAKGYAVDQLAAYLDGLGVESYFLEIGGELKIKGLKPGGVSWVPAIEAPLDMESRVYEIFYSRGETIGVAGSGDYRNYFEENGVRYSHEIDPRTGYPINHNLAAVYVIDPDTARADALATAFMVLGLEEGRELAQRENMSVYFIYKDSMSEFADFVTPGFEAYLNK